jgi:hypothetical protein
MSISSAPYVSLGRVSTLGWKYFLAALAQVFFKQRMAAARAEIERARERLSLEDAESHT